MDDTTAPGSAPQAALDALAQVSGGTSLVILALVVFFAWQLAVRRRHVAPARTSQPRSPMHRLRSSSALRALTDRGPLRVGAAAGSVPAAVRRVTGLRGRRTRAALFATALAALAVALVAGLAAALGAGTAGLAVAALLLSFGCLAGLRALAVRDRARRASAPAAPVAPAEAEATPVPEAPRADAERDRRVLETVLTFEDEAPRVVAEPPTPAAEPVVVAASATPEAVDTVTIPVVPRPTYLAAPEMHRPAPAPLAAPAAVGSDVRIKDAARAAARDEELSATAEQDIAALDLDNVLARRRAG